MDDAQHAAVNTEMILVGGHRGSGCTDSAHAAPWGRLKYAENTIPSIRKAISDGAEYIEVDVIQTKDDQLVVTHSNDLSQHVFGIKNLGFVSDYTLAELQEMGFGPKNDGVIPTLEEVLDLCSDITLNIEIKDVKGTDGDKFEAGRKLLFEILADKLTRHTGEIILSSFSEWDLKKAHELMPQVKLGMLFDTHDKNEHAIYKGGDDKSKYLHFTPKNLKKIASEFPISYAHPCLGSTPEESLKLCKELGLGVNAWSYNELPPTDNPAPITQCADVCLELDIPLTIMTDFVPEMVEFLESYNQKR